MSARYFSFRLITDEERQRRDEAEWHAQMAKQRVPVRSEPPPPPAPLALPFYRRPPSRSDSVFANMVVADVVPFRKREEAPARRLPPGQPSRQQPLRPAASGEHALKIFASIIKRDDEKRLVFGYASTEALDSQGERISKAAIEKALPDYMRWANVREMHQASAVGSTRSAEIDDKGLYIQAKIVDDAAWIKVKEGVYKGFSIGGEAISRTNEVITEIKLTEISLVDRPANAECAIELWKSASLNKASAANATPAPLPLSYRMLTWRNP
jgi:HK97 family phage prohead protease